MRKEIILSETEIKQILKKHFKLDIEPILYFHGGIINPKKISMVYYTFPE